MTVIYYNLLLCLFSLKLFFWPLRQAFEISRINCISLPIDVATVCTLFIKCSIKTGKFLSVNKNVSFIFALYPQSSQISDIRASIAFIYLHYYAASHHLISSFSCQHEFLRQQYYCYLLAIVFPL